MAVKANGETFETEIAESGKLVIADFYSDSCVPCKRMSPLLAEAEEQRENVKLVKLNINFDADTAVKYGVSAVPTLIFFVDDELRYGKSVCNFLFISRCCDSHDNISPYINIIR